MDIKIEMIKAAYTTKGLSKAGDVLSVHPTLAQALISANKAKAVTGKPVEAKTEAPKPVAKKKKKQL